MNTAEQLNSYKAVAAERIRCAIKDFQTATGLIITKVDVGIITHSTVGFGVDGSIITEIKFRTNADDPVIT